LICAEPETETVMFLAREKKGHEGIKNTPVETYQGIIVHDHDYPNLNKIQTFSYKSHI